MISLITTLNLYYQIPSLPALYIGYHQALFSCICLRSPKKDSLKLNLIWVCLYASLINSYFSLPIISFNITRCSLIDLNT